MRVGHGSDGALWDLEKAVDGAIAGVAVRGPKFDFAHVGRGKRRIGCGGSDGRPTVRPARVNDILDIPLNVVALERIAAVGGTPP